LASGVAVSTLARAAFQRVSPLPAMPIWWARPP